MSAALSRRSRRYWLRAANALFETFSMEGAWEYVEFMCATCCQLCSLLLKACPHQESGVYLMAKKALKRAWTPADLKTLKALSKKKTHAGRIAKALKRSEGATRQKAFSLGLSLDSR